MFLLTLLSLFFGYLLLRNIFGPNITGERFDAYFFILLTLSLVTASFPIRHTLFQLKLSDAVERLLGNQSVFVDCNSYFDSVFHFNMAGFVYRGSSEINLEVRTCNELKSYLSDPRAANDRERLALHVLTHEAMHVAGEFHEKTADCQAFQRNHRMAELLGVNKDLAIRHAINIHRDRSTYHPYYTEECEPGTKMDEGLPDAVWVGPNGHR